MNFPIPFLIYGISTIIASSVWGLEMACFWCLMFILAEIIQIKERLWDDFNNKTYFGFVCFDCYCFACF